MFKAQKEIAKSYSINIDATQEKPIFSVTIHASSCDYAINNYALKNNDYFKFVVNNLNITISITPHQQRGETDKLFANARSLLSKNSIITSRDSHEIESAYLSHMKKFGDSLSNSKDNHNIEREHHGSSFSF